MHIIPLYIIVLAWMDTLDPGRDHTEVARATALVSVRNPALYREDESRVRTAALLVAIQFRESAFDQYAVGDKGRSFCSMQIHSSIGGSPALLGRPEDCIEMGYSVLRQSISIDRSHPVAFYARGPRWKSVEAQRISNDRVAISRRLLASMPQ
jgi:hypothetical protein